MDIREEVLEMKKEVQEMQEESLAMSLLKDYKKVNERMFKIIVILIICWLLTIAGIIFYSCLPSEETSQEANLQKFERGCKFLHYLQIDNFNILIYN
ncbi:MAG: hypothetical protein SPJ27_06480 [Candidatus Onthovivens sp.]|nr:hypothetical protein [Candidatus Onthovivens sp.]